MNVLVACERTGRVRDAFRALGHRALSVDLLPSAAPGPHHVGDIFEFLASAPADLWDLLIAFPPCTYLSVSGLHWNGRRPGRSVETDAALAFVERLWRLPIKRKCLENPKGCINTRLAFMPKPQIIQPYQFGDDASKATCLWLDNLPRLRRAGAAVTPRIVNVVGSDLLGDPIGTPRWSNQTDSGQNKLSPSPERAQLRAETYKGIAGAMAAQWGWLF